MRLQSSAIAALLLISACGGPDTPEFNESEMASINAVAPEVSTLEATATRQAYFGDLHVHTMNSFDAYIFNVRATTR